MKYCCFKTFTLLFLIASFTLQTSLSKKRIEEKLKKTIQNLEKQINSRKKNASNRKLEMIVNSSSISSSLEKPNVKTRVYTIEELNNHLDSYAHNSWEIAEKLQALISASNINSSGKAKSKVQISTEEQIQLKKGISYVREANNALKYYIDHFILTKEVLEKYEQYISSHPEQGTSTNGILKFMIHEFRDIHLRRFDREFFEKVHFYSSVVKNKFAPLLYLPISNKDVHSLQLKLLNGERLIIFIKKYMSFVTRLKQSFHIFNYEKGNQLFKEPDADPKENRYKVVSNKIYELSLNRNKKKEKFVPVTIIIGNEPYGTKTESPAKQPSEFIENKEEISFSRSNFQQTENHFETIIDQSYDQNKASLNENQLSSQNKENQNSLTGGTLISMSEPAPEKRLRQELFVPENKIILPAKKFVNPLDLEKEEFINKRMKEIEKLYQTPPKDAGIQATYLPVEPPGGPSLTIESIKSAKENEVKKEIELEKQPEIMNNAVFQTQSPLSQNENDQQSLSKPSSISENTLNSNSFKSGEKELVEMSNDNLLEMDKNGIPKNLFIQRVPEIIKMDERYADPYFFAGKERTSLSSKIAMIDGKPITSFFDMQKNFKKNEAVPLDKRVVYHPNEVNGGLPNEKKSDIDEELNEIDRIVNDNGALSDKKLQQMDSAFNAKMPRNLWSRNIGDLYRKMMKKSII